MQENINTLLLCAFWLEFWGYVIAEEQGTFLNSSKTCLSSPVETPVIWSEGDRDISTSVWLIFGEQNCVP